MARGRRPPREAPRPPAPPLRPRVILDVLARHGVSYVLIGGVAERLWGSPRLTEDIDICPAAERANRQRLAAALNELSARFRPPGLESGMAPPESWYESSFGSFTSLALVTDAGWLDVWFRPDGTEGYRDLVADAGEMEIGGLSVQVASLDDIIRSKEATGGTRYLAQLPLLRELREQRRKLGESSGT